MTNIKLNFNSKKFNYDDVIKLKNFIDLFKDVCVYIDFVNENENYDATLHFQKLMIKDRDDIFIINNDYNHDENKVVRIYKIINNYNDLLDFDYYKAYKVSNLHINICDKNELIKTLNLLVTNYPFLVNSLINRDLFVKSYLYIMVDENMDVYLTDFTFEKINEFKLGNLNRMNEFNFELMHMNKREFFTDDFKCNNCSNLFCKASPIKNFKTLYNKKYIDKEQCNMYKTIEQFIVHNNYNMMYNILSNYMLPNHIVLDSYEKINESLNKIEDRLQGIEKRCDKLEK